MGSASSKAAGRSYNAVQAGSKTASASSQPLTGSVAADAARATQAAHRPTLTLEQEEELEKRDQSFGSLLDQLGGSLQRKTLNISPTKEQLMQSTVAQMADSSGRLPPDALRSLLMLQAQAAGGPLQAERLLQRYKVDPALVQRALSRVCLPDIVEAEGPGSIKAFAEWPVWFQRRS